MNKKPLHLSGYVGQAMQILREEQAKFPSPVSQQKLCWV